MGDDGILQLAAPTSRNPEKVTVPAQKPFNGKLEGQGIEVDRMEYIGSHPRIETRGREEQLGTRNHNL